MAKVGTRQRQRVLVVDRDELVRWSVAEGLREHGYSVHTAATAHGALRCPGVALALLDHDPPHVDGLAAADHLRRRHPRCAVVLMTPEPTPELSRRARERGIVPVLGKPFSLEALVDAVRDALEGAPGPAARRRQRRGPQGTLADARPSRVIESTPWILPKCSSSTTKT